MSTENYAQYFDQFLKMFLHLLQPSPLLPKTLCLYSRAIIYVYLRSSLNLFRNYLLCMHAALI